MSSNPQHLDPPELLLLYLAGELSPAEHAEVERKLQADPALRAQLGDLAAANDSVTGMLSRLDAPIADSSREAAVRSVSRALAAAKADRLAMASAITRPQRPPLNLRRFLVPLAGAAALVGGILLWPRTIQMPARQTAQYVETEFPDILAFERRPQPEADPLTHLEQELLSLGNPATGLDAAWNLTDDQTTP
jgi:anti-sigma factor RsiW